MEPLGLFYINLPVPIFLLTRYNAGMTESEHHRKMNSRFATIPYSVTPNQIQNYLKGPMEIFDAEGAVETLLENFPDEVMSIFETSNGKLKRNRVHKLKESLELLSSQFKLEDFLKIEVSCLCNDGSVDESKFREVLKAKKTGKID